MINGGQRTIEEKLKEIAEWHKLIQEGEVHIKSDFKGFITAVHRENYHISSPEVLGFLDDKIILKGGWKGVEDRTFYVDWDIFSKLWKIVKIEKQIEE